MKNQYLSYKSRVQSQNQAYSLTTSVRAPMTAQEEFLGADIAPSEKEF